VKPPSLRATSLGEEKTYDIEINEVDVQHRLVGVEFKVRFDKTLLGVVGAVEGSFMKDPAWALNGTQFVGPIVEEDGTDGSCSSASCCCLTREEIGPHFPKAAEF
jgi:hypothetical protein